MVDFRSLPISDFARVEFSMAFVVCCLGASGFRFWFRSWSRRRSALPRRCSSRLAVIDTCEV
eukprot:scaffold48_cov311-Pinguiococcus_pyrenoidosus.AAC.29